MSLSVKGETTIDSNTTPLIKQSTVDEDEYLVPSRAEVGSDEYLKVEIEKQNSNETKAKSEEEGMHEMPCYSPSMTN